MKNLSASTYFGLFILSCILAAMVSIAVMQVVRTVEDVGPMIYIVGGAVGPHEDSDHFDDGDHD